MYTGLVQALGKLGYVSHLYGCTQVRIESQDFDFSDLQLGDSIAVNGVCLTVTRFTDRSFEADVSPETLALTTIPDWGVGTLLNLEKSLRLQDRLGGHFVQGHVDGIGVIESITPRGGAYQVRVRPPAELLKYIVYKGAISVDGVSLTVNGVDPETFELTVIPHSWTHTVFHTYRVGSRVNLEVDIIARYLERLLKPSEHLPVSQGLTLDALLSAGFANSTR
jgi:riboflavin synthase